MLNLNAVHIFIFALRAVLLLYIVARGEISCFLSAVRGHIKLYKGSNPDFCISSSSSSSCCNGDGFSSSSYCCSYGDGFSSSSSNFFFISRQLLLTIISVRASSDDRRHVTFQRRNTNIWT